MFVVLGLLVLHNQKLTVSDPENTYPKRIKRAIRLLLNPAENELEKHLIGKAIPCEDREQLYKTVAAATVVIKADGSLGAGVFIGPRLIATAEHVVDGRDIRVFTSSVKPDALAEPGEPIDVDSIHRVRGLDLAFVLTKQAGPAWLNLEKDYGDEKYLMIVGHPKGKYYSLQKARIKKKDMIATSDYVIFKDNEIFFGNSGGAIVGCNGNLVGIVSMMSDYQNSMRKQGIGINSLTISGYVNRLKLG